MSVNKYNGTDLIRVAGKGKKGEDARTEKLLATIIGDGVKTFGELLNELYTYLPESIEDLRHTYILGENNNFLKFDKYISNTPGIEAEFVYYSNISMMGSDTLQIASCTVASNNSLYYNIRMKSTPSITFNKFDDIVASSGYTFKLYLY